MFRRSFFILGLIAMLGGEVRASLSPSRRAAKPPAIKVPKMPAPLRQPVPVGWSRAHRGEYSLSSPNLHPWGLLPIAHPGPAAQLWLGHRPRRKPTIRTRFILPGQTAARGRPRAGLGALNSLVYRPGEAEAPLAPFQEAALSPVWMTRSYWHISRSGAPLESLLTLTHGQHQGGSLLFSDDLLNVKKPDWVPVDAVKPRFPEGWNANVSYRWGMHAVPTNPALRFAIGFSDNLRFGYELGASNDYLSASFFDEIPYPGSPAGDGYHYLSKLVQAEAKYPFRTVTPYFGVKTHWTEKDLWLRTGFRFPTSTRTSLDLGTDIFMGAPGTYFWGWRESDRVFAVFTLML